MFVERYYDAFSKAAKWRLNFSPGGPAPEHVARLLGECLVLEAIHRLDPPGIEYTIYHPSFEVRPEGSFDYPRLYLHTETTLELGAYRITRLSLRNEAGDPLVTVDFHRC